MYHSKDKYEDDSELLCLGRMTRSRTRKRKNEIPALQQPIEIEQNQSFIPFRCKTCKKTFKTAKGLKQHKPIKKMYPEEICIFECELCMERFFDPLDYLDHREQEDMKLMNARIITKKCNEQLELFTVEETTKTRNTTRTIDTGMSVLQKEFDNPDLTDMELLSYQCSIGVRPSFVTCTVCFKKLDCKPEIEEHLLRHNFFSCSCPVCEWQLAFFNTM